MHCTQIGGITVFLKLAYFRCCRFAEASSVFFVAGILAELMSGQPGEIPKFIDDMIKPSSAENCSEEVHPSRPKSEVARTCGNTQPSHDARPKSDIPRESDATRLSCQTRQMPAELREKEARKSTDEGRATAGEVGTVPRYGQSPPKSEGKPGTGSTEEKPPPITISKETQKLVDELQIQYSLPVFINDGVQQLVDRERSILSSSGDSHRQKSEQCKRSFSHCHGIISNTGTTETLTLLKPGFHYPS